MCGRYVTPAVEHVEALFDIEALGADLPEPSYNTPPTDPVPVVVEPEPKGGGDAVRRVERARWGLLPSFAKDPSFSSKAFNARIETVLEKPTFRGPVKQRRVIVPAVGYYEWRKTADGTKAGSKTPYFIHPEREDDLIAFAGLYSWWADPTKPGDDPSRWVLSTTILTRGSTGELAGIHDRMPLMLPRALWDQWLDQSVIGTQGLLDEASQAGVELASTLVMHEVGPEVGRVASTGAQLMAPVGAASS